MADRHQHERSRYRWGRALLTPAILLLTANLATVNLGLAAELRGGDARDNPASERRDVLSDQEQIVLQMVNNYLPELKTLLTQLRDKEPSQYDIAIRNLARSAKRLEIAQKRGEEAFELEVNVVQAQSSVNLLIAKLKVRDSQKDRKALRDAAKQLATAELARSKHDVALMRSRIKRLQEQLAAAEKRLTEKESELDKNIEKNFQAYLKKLGHK